MRTFVLLQNSKQPTMKRLFTLLIACLSLAACNEQSQSTLTLFAHRGCWSKSASGEFIVPENSLPAVAMAKTMGYTGIECDVHYTKDNVMVILHDATLNRTMRRAEDYSRLTEPVRLSDLTFEELRRDYVLESTNPEWRTPIPTLEELLAECKKHGIVPMLHSALMPSYHVAQQMFSNEWVCFTSDLELLKQVRDFSDCTILYSISEGTAEETIAKLEQIGGHCGISSMNYELYTEEFCHALTDKGYIVQASIFPAPHEAIAQRNGITYQLTDFSIMPQHKPIDKGETKNLGSDDEATWEYTSEQALERGAITLDVEFEGEIEVTINNERTYTLNRATFGKDKIGGRLFDKAPSAKVTAKQGATVKKATAKIYEY